MCTWCTFYLQFCLLGAILVSFSEITSFIFANLFICYPEIFTSFWVFGPFSSIISLISHSTIWHDRVLLIWLWIMKSNLPSIIIQRKRRRNCWILVLIVSSVAKWLYRVKIHSCKLFNRCDINDDLDNWISYLDQRGILTAHPNIYFPLKRICKGEKVSSDSSFFSLM